MGRIITTCEQGHTIESRCRCASLHTERRQGNHAKIAALHLTSECREADVIAKFNADKEAGIPQYEPAKGVVSPIGEAWTAYRKDAGLTFKDMGVAHRAFNAGYRAGRDG